MAFAFAAVALVVVGVGVIALVGSRMAPTTTTAEPGYEGYRPSPVGTVTPRSTAATATATTTTVERTTTQPPAEPSPTAQPRPVLALADHPINRDGLGLATVTCTLPRFAQDPAGQDRFYRAAAPCLDAAWSPALAAANLPFRSPVVETITDQVGTPCGNQSPDRTAFYCPGNGVIYMTPLFYAPRFGGSSGAYLSVLAHEYGHHVQGVSGIFDAYWDLRYEAGPDSDVGLELSRRLELQATCYAGMFVAVANGRGSVDGAVAADMLGALGNSGDDVSPGLPRDHGTIANNTRWANHGNEHNLVWQCNTWRANAATVG